MQVVGIEKYYADAKDFLVIVLKDAGGIFHSEIYEVANKIPVKEGDTHEEISKKSLAQIQSTLRN